MAETGEIYTRERIARMTREEYTRHRGAIMDQLRRQAEVRAMKVTAEGKAFSRRNLRELRDEAD